MDVSNALAALDERICKEKIVNIDTLQMEESQLMSLYADIETELKNLAKKKQLDIDNSKNKKESKVLVLKARQQSNGINDFT